jgi:hypothetical protein
MLALDIGAVIVVGVRVGVGVAEARGSLVEPGESQR